MRNFHFFSKLHMFNHMSVFTMNRNCTLRFYPIIHLSKIISIGVSRNVNKFTFF